MTSTNGVALDMISIIRVGAATHSTNTDQRRLQLCKGDCNRAGFQIPGAGAATPGMWMVFGMSAQGVPSEAKFLKIMV